MGKDFKDFDGAFADFFDDQRSGGNLSKSFGAAAHKGAGKQEYAVHAAVDLGNIAELGARKR